MTFPRNVIRSQTENVIAARKAGVNTFVKTVQRRALKTKMETVFPGSAD